jgi:hypothetical protein
MDHSRIAARIVRTTAPADGRQLLRVPKVWIEECSERQYRRWRYLLPLLCDTAQQRQFRGDVRCGKAGRACPKQAVPADLFVLSGIRITTPDRFRRRIFNNFESLLERLSALFSCRSNVFSRQ